MFIVIFCLLGWGIMTCTVCGENPPEYLISISGNSSVITTGTGDDYLFSVNDVNPNASISSPNWNITSVLLEKVLAPESYNTALILSKSTGEKETFMVKMETPIYSPGNKTFSSTLIPMDFYDGTLLGEYNEQQGEFRSGEYESSHIMMESSVHPAENDGIDDCSANPALCFNLPSGDILIKSSSPTGNSCDPLLTDCTPYK